LKSELPLSGIRVLDLSRVLAGPYCAMILADLGAEVLKVEQPGRGDETRSWGPPFAEDGNSGYFMAANRNKRLVQIDLKNHEQRSDFERLVQASDVLIHNFTPAVAHSLKLDESYLRQLKPGIVIASISGYGHDNEFSDQPGYDFLVQAMSGLMSISGEVNSAPMKLGIAITDVLSALYAAIGILASLHAQRSGKESSKNIDISLMQSAVSSLVNVGQAFLLSGKPPSRFGNAHPQIVPYELFRSKDSHFALAVGNDQQFGRLCAAIQLPHLSIDPLFSSNPARVVNRGQLIDQLQAVFARKTTDEWIETIGSADIPIGPVWNIDQILSSEWAQQRQVVCVDEQGNKHLQSPLAKSFHMSNQVRSAPGSKSKPLKYL
jgi:crotonobetainyl-CoA:carnitine CoA-transferase CaiB-like acyl-CoA transferase